MRYQAPILTMCRDLNFFNQVYYQLSDLTHQKKAVKSESSPYEEVK
jgi:hypothetical protein